MSGAGYRLVAPCVFGVEGLLAGELREMGAGDVAAENGRVFFSGGAEMVARANVRSRLAERVGIVAGRFPAATFTELFDGARDLPWEEFIGWRDAFPVTGHSVNSALRSVPDCQRIIKKAVVERLRAAYRRSVLPEDGGTRKIRFTLLKDEATLVIETSGEPLHKRGYRKNANAAPLKETLAAAVCSLARIYPDTRLIDPFCGSGTLLIEGAMMAENVAPGLRRRFAGESYPFLPPAVWKREREAARAARTPAPDFSAAGYDIDPSAVELTFANANAAGVGDKVAASVRDFAEFIPPEERFTLVTNPPYGERMLDPAAAADLSRLMGEKFARRPGAKYFILSADPDFEEHFSRPADRRRKLYNGMLPTALYSYFRG